MDEKELIQFLKDKLKIKITQRIYYLGRDEITVKLKLCGEEISTDTIELDYEKNPQ